MICYNYIGVESDFITKNPLYSHILPSRIKIISPMSKKIKISLFCLLSSITTFSQVGIGTTIIDNSAQLELLSADKGILVPRMNESQRLAITSPAQGLLIYQIDQSQGFWFFDGTIWRPFSSAGWALEGNSGTDPAVNYVGTSDPNGLSVITNNTERLRIDETQQIGIGVNNPQRRFHIEGTAPLIRIEDGNQADGRVLVADGVGGANWQDYPGSGVQIDIDGDWIFSTFDGSGLSESIERTGDVRIGSTGTPNYLLDINNGATSGTEFGIGDVEFIRDGNGQTLFSHQLSPETDDASFLGLSQGVLRRWRNVYATNGVSQTSDENTKTNIAPLQYGIKELMKIRPVSFYWKSEKFNNIEIPHDKKQKRLGFIAQELDEIIPEVVYKSKYMSKSEEELDVYVKKEFERIGVNYAELIPVLIKASQEQQERIQKLIKENEDMKNVLINYKKK